MLGLILIALLTIFFILSIAKDFRKLKKLEEKILGRPRSKKGFVKDFEEMLKGHEKVWAKEDKKREKKREYQRKYRAKKKLEKRVHILMMEVQAQNREHLEKFDRFDIMDFE